MIYDGGLSPYRMFAICLGKNGGYLQLGGYDSQGALQNIMDWANLLPNHNFKIEISGVKIGDQTISSQHTVGLIDSGSTFSYFPSSLLGEIRAHLI